MGLRATVLHHDTEPSHFWIRTDEAHDHGPISSENPWVRKWALGFRGTEQRATRRRGGAAGTAGSHTPLNEEDQELLKTFRKEVRSLNLPQQFPGNIQIPRVSSGSVGPARRNELCAKGRFEPPHRDTCGSSGSPRVSLTVGTSLRTKAGARFARWLKGGQGCVESPRAFYKQEKALCPTNSREQHRFLTGVGVTPHSPPLSCQETGAGGGFRERTCCQQVTNASGRGRRTARLGSSPVCERESSLVQQDGWPGLLLTNTRLRARPLPQPQQGEPHGDLSQVQTGAVTPAKTRATAEMAGKAGLPHRTQNAVDGKCCSEQGQRWARVPASARIRTLTADVALV